MPGVNLNLDLPSLSDSLSVIVSKTVTALSSIENDLAPKVTAGELNINAALPCNGNAITGLGSIQLASGNTPTAAGSVYYMNGEFYAIDSTGVIQLTLNGSINASGIGGIVGDYGGTNPARVTYVDSSHQYQFTSSPGVWADLVAGHLIMEGTNGTVQFGVDDAINTARQFNIKSLPTSGVSVLVYNAATSTVENGGATTVTNPLVLTADVTCNQVHEATSRVLVIPASDGYVGTSTAAKISDGTWGSVTSWHFINDGNTGYLLFPVRLPQKAVIDGYGVRGKNNSGSTKNLTIYFVQNSDGTASVADSDNAGGYSSSLTNTQVKTTQATNAPIVSTFDGTKAYYIAVHTDGASDFNIYWAFVTYHLA